MYIYFKVWNLNTRIVLDFVSFKKSFYCINNMVRSMLLQLFMLSCMVFCVQTEQLDLQQLKLLL